MSTFFIEGTPAPQGSKRHIGNGRMVEASKKLPKWRKQIIDTIQAQYEGEPIDRPVRVTAYFFMPKPAKPRFDTPATMPDLDKLCRALGDGLEQSGLLKNDSRIVCWNATKHYGTPTGVQVIIEEHEGD